MSGVFGVIDSNTRALSTRIERMAHEMRLREWTRTQVWSDDVSSVALGQVNIGLFSSDVQPFRSEDGTLAVVFFGELYYTRSLRRQLMDDGYALTAGTEAELVCRLYQAKGEGFVRHLEGVFELALWDRGRGYLWVVNDRFGLIPLYYAHYDGKLVFAPEIKAILSDQAIEKQLDWTGVAQFFRFQRLLGDRTFFEGIHLLPYASVLRYDQASDALDVSHYWDFDRIPTQPVGVTFEDAVVETGRLLRRAVETRTQGEHRIGVYLSGGLDSRTVLGLASQMSSPIVSLTYGLPNCRDAHYARQIGRRVGSLHYFFPQTDGRWVRDEVDFHLEATEGFTTWVHSHAAPTLIPARRLMDVNLTGFEGDQVLGGRAIFFAPLLRYATDDIAFGCHAFQYLNQACCWPGITEAEERTLYTPATYAEVGGRAWDSLQEELKSFKAATYDRQWDFFTTIHQGTRLSNLNLVYQRAFLEVRYPFCDYDLVDFVYSLPTGYRLGDRLYLAVINQEVPKVTWVPRDTDEKLLTDFGLIREVHGWWQKVRRRVVRRNRPRIHEDPENWLRNDLREWAEALLFDPCTLERGILNSAYIHSIFERHMSGYEVHTIGKIAPVMTFEMMLRRFYD